MSEPLTLTIERALAREPDVELIRLGIEIEFAHAATIEFDVIVAGRVWELCALPAKMARVIEDHERLQAWLGGNLTPIGPIVDPCRSLAARLTPVRAYADLVFPIGNRVVFDELDHVVPAGTVLRRPLVDVTPFATNNERARGVVIDVQPEDGTVDVIITGRFQ